MKNMKFFFKTEISEKALFFWEFISPIIVLSLLKIFNQNNLEILKLYLLIYAYQNIIFSVSYRLNQYKKERVIYYFLSNNKLKKFLNNFYVSRYIFSFATFMFIALSIYLLFNIQFNFIELLINYTLIYLIAAIQATIIGLITKTERSVLSLAQLFYFFEIGVVVLSFSNNNILISKILTKFSVVLNVNKIEYIYIYIFYLIFFIIFLKKRGIK